jgi:hypothetical protein
MTGLLLSRFASLSRKSIQYVGAKGHGEASGTTAFNVSLTDLAGGTGSAPLEGDLVLVGVTVPTDLSGDITITLGTSGYTKVIELFADDADNTNFALFWKVMGSTPDTVVNVEREVSSSPTVNVRVYRNVHKTTPLDVTEADAIGINGGRPDPASITPATSGAWVVVFGGNCTPTSGNDDFTSSDLEAFIRATQTNPNRINQTGSGHVSDWTGGAVDPAEFGGGSTNADCSWATVTLALRLEA